MFILWTPLRHGQRWFFVELTVVNFPICGWKTHLEIWEQLKNEKQSASMEVEFLFLDANFKGRDISLKESVGKSSWHRDPAEFPGRFWNISLVYKFVICCIYSLVCNRIHFIPSQTNVRLGFYDRSRIKSCKVNIRIGMIYEIHEMTLANYKRSKTYFCRYLPRHETSLDFRG